MDFWSAFIHEIFLLDVSIPVITMICLPLNTGENNYMLCAVRSAWSALPCFTNALTMFFAIAMKCNKEKHLTWCSHPPQACALEWVSIFPVKQGPEMPCTLKCRCFQKRVYDFPLVENKLVVRISISCQPFLYLIRSRLHHFYLSMKNMVAAVNNTKTDSSCLRELKI